jgi:chaperonin cofactor prefoldin
MCYGNTFIKIEKKECIRILETDQKTIDEEIETLRDGLKPKVNRLHAMEGKKESKGFQLKGLKEEELFHAAEHYTISSSALNQ